MRRSADIFFCLNWVDSLALLKHSSFPFMRAIKYLFYIGYLHMHCVHHVCYAHTLNTMKVQFVQHLYRVVDHLELLDRMIEGDQLGAGGFHPRDNGSTWRTQWGEKQKYCNIGIWTQRYCNIGIRTQKNRLSWFKVLCNKDPLTLKSGNYMAELFPNSK